MIKKYFFMSYELLKTLHEGEPERKEKRGLGVEMMWMLLSPNKVFCLEPRPC